MFETLQQRFFHVTEAPDVDAISCATDRMVHLDRFRGASAVAHRQIQASVGDRGRHQLLTAQHRHATDDHLLHRPARMRAKVAANDLGAETLRHKMKKQRGIGAQPRFQAGPQA